MPRGLAARGHKHQPDKTKTYRKKERKTSEKYDFQNVNIELGPKLISNAALSCLDCAEFQERKGTTPRWMSARRKPATKNRTFWFRFHHKAHTQSPPPPTSPLTQQMKAETKGNERFIFTGC